MTKALTGTKAKFWHYREPSVGARRYAEFVITRPRAWTVKSY